MARKLLHFSPDLKDYSVQKLNETQLPDILPYIEALRLLDRVIESCFKQTRSPDFIKHIKNYEMQYRSLEISIPLKVYDNCKLYIFIYF